MPTIISLEHFYDHQFIFTGPIYTCYFRSIAISIFTLANLSNTLPHKQTKMHSNNWFVDIWVKLTMKIEHKNKMKTFRSRSQSQNVSRRRTKIAQVGLPNTQVSTTNPKYIIYLFFFFLFALSFPLLFVKFHSQFRFMLSLKTQDSRQSDKISYYLLLISFMFHFFVVDILPFNVRFFPV